MCTTRPGLAGTHGMVATTHWLASAAGMAVLETGDRRAGRIPSLRKETIARRDHGGLFILSNHHPLSAPDRVPAVVRRATANTRAAPAAAPSISQATTSGMAQKSCG